MNCFTSLLKVRAELEALGRQHLDSEQPAGYGRTPLYLLLVAAAPSVPAGVRRTGTWS